MDYGYDRLGRQVAVTQTVAGATSTISLAYNDAGELLSEAWSGGTLDGITVSNLYDQYLRRTNLAAQASSTRLLQHAYAYDAASRLQTVSDGTNSATYSYVANSPLVGQIVFSQNGATRMTTTRTYDSLNRLQSVASVLSAASTLSSTYSYNNANQRTRNTKPDGSYWAYEFDGLGQVKSGKKYWSDGSLVAGQQFEYAFDDIGNRTRTKTGGDQSGADLRVANYEANFANQYTNRDVPGYMEILGLSFATNTVTVNGLPAYRKGEYFRKELALDNTNQPLWTNVTVAATGCAPAAGHAVVAQTPEVFTYDADGNLTEDGRWSYTWDAENRLVSMESLDNAPEGSELRLDFAYDYNGRRIQKVVSTWEVWEWVPQSTNLFVYDGWNLIATLNPQLSTLNTFMWGLDLSGSMQGAGGVGGLLAVSDPSTINNEPSTHLACFDGNGNVSALVNAADGTPSAQYEYGPFGELLRASGPVAKANPLRFSTKYQDDETDLVYFGYRLYAASLGRWTSRDPAFDPGFQATARLKQSTRNQDTPLYAFVANAPVGRMDFLGLFADHPTGPADHCGDPCGDAKRAGYAVGPHGEPLSGGVICCSGKKYTCIWATAPGGADASNPTARAIIGRCITAHENTHVSQVDCPKCWKRGFPTRPPFRDQSAARANECAGYRAELNCLNNNVAACGGDAQCLAQVSLAITNAQLQININCK